MKMMKRLSTVAATLFGLVTCALAQSITNVTPEPPPYLFTPPVVTYSGGDGSSISNAVIIKGAISTTLGISAEQHWIHERHGYIQPTRQTLQEHEGRHFDVNTYQRGTNTFAVFFDITDFFGKDHVGEWRCTFADGEADGGRMSFANERPWEQIISNRTATLHYHEETECNNGRVAIVPFKNGKPNGLCKHWLRIEGTSYTEFKDGMRNGIDYHWHTNGVPWIEQHYSNDVAVGWYRRWHPTGQLSGEVEMRDGEYAFEDGHTGWHPNGSVASRRYRLPGTNRWMLITFYPDGKPQRIEYNTTEENTPDTHMSWHTNGLLQELVVCDDGKLGASIFWNEDGRKDREYLFVTNDVEVARTWNRDGSLATEGFYKSGKRWSGNFPAEWGHASVGKAVRFENGKRIDNKEDAQHKPGTYFRKLNTTP